MRVTVHGGPPVPASDQNEVVVGGMLPAAFVQFRGRRFTLPKSIRYIAAQGDEIIDAETGEVLPEFVAEESA